MGALNAERRLNYSHRHHYCPDFLLSKSDTSFSNRQQARQKKHLRTEQKDVGLNLPKYNEMKMLTFTTVHCLKYKPSMQTKNLVSEQEEAA